MRRCEEARGGVGKRTGRRGVRSSGGSGSPASAHSTSRRSFSARTCSSHASEAVTASGRPSCARVRSEAENSRRVSKTRADGIPGEDDATGRCGSRGDSLAAVRVARPGAGSVRLAPVDCAVVCIAFGFGPNLQ